MIPGLHKLRYLLAARPELLRRVCIAVALVSVIAAGFTFVNPPTTEVTATADRQTITTTLNSQATVAENSSLYPRGEVLSDMPVYPRSVAPNATVTAVTTPSKGESVRIDQRIVLVYEARTARGETFWRRTRILERTNTSTDGDEVVSNATLRITAIERQVAQIESEIGDAGRVTTHLEVESRYDTTHYEGSSKGRGAIRIHDGSYEIDRLSLQDEYGATETEMRPILSKTSRLSLPLVGVLVVPHTTLAFALLTLCGAIGAGVTVAFAHRFKPEIERAALHAARYAEWISQGTLPSGFEDRAVYMETLEDLVDVAIDSEKRIVHDRSREVYAVIDAHATYIYSETS